VPRPDRVDRRSLSSRRAAAVRASDQASAGAAHTTSIGPAGGPLVRQADRLTADWSFGAGSDAPVRRLVRGAGHRRPTHDSARGRALVIGCGALARELVAVTERIPGLDVACLAPDLHNRPDGIPAAVRARIQRARADGYERIFVAYADCGTGGLLEPVLAQERVERLPGAHCYEVFAGAAFAEMADAEPGTFWLTDFLARNFERLVIRGLGIDRHPELQAVYFANYQRVVYLSQTDDPDLLVLARRAAERLGLTFEHRPTGIAGLAAPIVAFAERAASRAGGSNSHRVGVSNEFDADGRGYEPEIGSIRPNRVDPARRAGTDGRRPEEAVRYARGMGRQRSSHAAKGSS
jgi:hypothetical protein